MRPVTNHVDLRGRLVELFDDYHQERDMWLRRLAQQYRRKTPGDPPPHIREVVEAQARCLFIDPFLEALNWSVSPSTDGASGHTSVEVRVDAASCDRRYVLDYLGQDLQTDQPLLLVEAKRPHLQLPGTQDLIDGINGDSSRLRDEWKDLILQIYDYVRGIHERAGVVPKRVLITNAYWFVILLKPSVLHECESAERDDLLVIGSPEDAQDKAHLLFDSLCYEKLAGRRPLFSVNQLRGSVSKRDVVDIAFGLRLMYIDSRSFEARVPQLRIRPVVFVFARSNRWLIVERDQDEQALPENEADLVAHLAWTRIVLTALKSHIDGWVGRQLRVRSLREYFRSTTFDFVPAVQEVGPTTDRVREFTVVTGEHTHFLRKAPTVPNCRFHDHGECVRAGAACRDGPVTRASITPCSFYVSGMKHHCAHGHVYDVKQQRIEPPATEMCGRRSNNHGDRPGGPFCEIFSFEKHLCCRTCSFEEVCESSELFHLPCQRGR